MEVKTRSQSDLQLMRESGLITARALKKTLGSVKEGITLEELDKIAEDEILNLGGQPSFKTVPGYKWTSCLTLNHEVVHGIPRDIRLKAGDILSIDLGTVYKGWHTDAAWSVLIMGKGKGGNRQERILPKVGGNGDKVGFLRVGEEALWKGIQQAVDGNRIKDISQAIQSVVEGNNYSVVRDLVGHGIGKNLHEDPPVPGFVTKGTEFVLKAGMTIAIEAIYTMGKSDVVLEPDGWTVSAADRSLGGLFEMTVIVGNGKAEVLTDWRK